MPTAVVVLLWVPVAPCVSRSSPLVIVVREARVLSDSSYDVWTPALTPREGLVAGLASALVMLMFVAATWPLGGLDPSHVLTRVGERLPSLLGSDISPAFVGAGVHLFVGALLGLLYAACQRRISTRGLIGVGGFYGFVVWIVGGLLAGWLFGGAVHDVVRSASWLEACLLYGFCLAITAAWAVARRPAPMVAAPLD